MLNLAFAPMALAQQSFPVGSAIRVTVAFKYTAGVNTAITLKAGPYYTNILGSHMVDVCVGTADISLPAASTPTDKTATVDFTLVPKAQGGIEDGTYGLRVWVDGTNIEASQDNVVIVTGNPAAAPDTFSAMLPMLMMLMMMGMVMPMVQGIGGE
jgi:hypothetical protein